MSASDQSAGGADRVEFALQDETLDAIEALLLRHTEDGYRRGLFAREQLEGIRSELRGLATWSAANKAERIRAADRHFSPSRRFSHQDALCIAYVDHVVSSRDDSPAETLRDLFNRHLADLYNHVHVLPHFPCPLVHPELPGPASRADGGFEPMGYRMDPKYGQPRDLQDLSAGLMFDFVLNHLSVKGEWFQRFLEDDPQFRDFFVTIPAAELGELDLTDVFRPRQHHPVFEFTNSHGQTKHVWCTFSETQADLNIKNPRVFVRVMEALVKDFVGEGASWIRLDAVGYLVKMIGLDGEPRTSSFGIRETHSVLKAMNLLLRDIAPSVTLVAEVNATKDVIATYFGENGDECHMAYDFPLAPLSLFATYTGNAAPVLDWARERAAHPERIVLAFTSSHDGIGVLPMADVDPLPNGTSSLDYLLAEVTKRGAGINFKRTSAGGEPVDVPYEACITWGQAVLAPEELAALREDRLSRPDIDRIADRFLASQSYMFSGPHCVPGDFLGAIALLLNDDETYRATDHKRNKNRGQIDADAFEKALTDPKTNHERLVHAVFERKARMLRARRSTSAFSPYAPCEVEVVDVAGATAAVKPVFSLLRRSPEGPDAVLVLTNSSASPQEVRVSHERLGLPCPATLHDLLSNKRRRLGREGSTLLLDPHQVAWLRIDESSERQHSRL